ncbi:MAG: DNA polymerase I [Clostridia bacterium]|nr:DNA polymerase I [Clostridia bacterium]
MSKLVLIDGNSLINRAFYATPPLSDKNGTPTNAVYGFINMLIKMIGDLKPEYVTVAFDVHAPTFRHGLYSEYKGTRKPMPEDLRPQIPLLKKVLSVMGIKIVELAGFEADDLIGTLAKRCSCSTVIITGDKDSFQLVDESTSVYFTKRGITDVDVLDLANFTEKTGIKPNQVIELKALMGDGSDNIPGIPGVGEKTALNLVTTYGSLENLYANLQDFKGKLLEKIVNGKESAFLSRTLATINTNVDIPFEFSEATYKFPFSSEVKRLFSELEFRGFLKRTELFEEGEEQALNEEKTLSKQVIIETESDLKPVYGASELSIVMGESVSVYLPSENTEYTFKIKETFFDDGFDFSDSVKLLAPVLESNEKTVIAYSTKKIADQLLDYGVNFNSKVEDVDILKYLVDFSGSEETLENVLYTYGLDKKTPAFSQYLLFLKLKESLFKQGLDKLYYEVELPLSKILLDMERTGFKLDISALELVGNEYKQEIAVLLENIYREAGEEFNPNSPKQLQHVLFEKLGLKAGKKNKNGSYSTNANILEELENEHPIIPLILRYRHLQKLVSTYIDGFKPLVDKQTGLVHTCFNQTLTQTGRLSSKEPNLQNIPVRDEEGNKLRKFFIPSAENRVLIGADYSQIELRLLAHFSGTKKLVKAYNDGEDIHTQTASQVFGVNKEEVTSQMRRSAKAVNFGIIYGISEYGLSKNLKISPREASAYIKRYFETYPEVKEYMDKNVAFARENGYVSTLLGRRRYIREINSPNFNVRSFGERAAMNMPLQGSSADIIKLAMVNVYNRLKRENVNAKLILQVHDELILDASEEHKDLAKRILVEEMENAVKLSVPLTVDSSEGKTWYDAK